MSPRRSSALLVGAALAMTACAGMVAHRQYFAAKYDAPLVEVARPTATKQQYGAVDVITIGDSSRYRYEDGLVAVQIAALDKALYLDVRNKTDHSIKVIWDETSFIDLDGVLSRVMHTGVKYVDRNASQPPTVIPAHQHLADELFPTDRVWYQDGTEYSGGGWKHGYLLKPIDTGVTVQPGAPPATVPDSFATAVRARIGNRFGVVIPFEVEGVKNEYTFWFGVKNASVVPE